MPGAVAERLVDRLAEHDADVLGRVVGAGLQVALGLDLQAQAPVAGEQVEHVVEEADAGRDARLAAVQGQLQGDLGLLGARARSRRCGSLIGSSPRARSLGPRRTPRAPGSPRRAASVATTGASSAAPRSVSRTVASRRLKVAGAERALEAAGAAGRQHVVGAGGVVAERGGAARGRRRRSPRSARLGAARRPRRRPARGARGRARSASSTAASVEGAVTSASGASSTLGRSLAQLGDQRARARPAAPASGGAGDQQPVVAVLGLGAEVERQPGAARRSPSAITISSLGPAMPSMPTRPDELALRLLHVAVAGADDHVHRLDVSVPSASAAIACAPPIA